MLEKYEKLTDNEKAAELFQYAQENEASKKGHGGSKGDSEIVGWYRKAAGMGHPGAQFRMGQIFEKGEFRGFRKSPEGAAKWYKKSADQGYEPAVEKMKEFEKYLK